MSGFLNNIAIALEKFVGEQLSKGEYRLGTIDLNSVSEIAPLNQKFEILLLNCHKCGKVTAFLSLGQLDNYIDNEKNSILRCRHCQLETKIPKLQQVRQEQNRDYNFLEIEDWKSTKILSKRGKIINLSISDKKFLFQISDGNEIKVEIPPTKLKQLQNIKLFQNYRVKLKVFQSKMLDPKKAFLKKPEQMPELSYMQKYELISVSKVK